MQQNIRKVLKDLADIEPYRPAKKLYMERARKLSRLLLGLSVACVLALGALGLLYKLVPSPVLAYLALASWLLSTLLAMLSMLVEPVVTFWRMLRWKEETLDTFVREIEHDETHVQHLMYCNEATLKRVQHLLQLKVKRLDARIVLLFGGSTAVYSLLALSVSNIKDADGLSWLGHTFLRGFAAGNMVNTAILWAIAFVFGASVGAILMKMVQGRYVYQLEVVEMALMSHSPDATSESPSGGR